MNVNFILAGKTNTGFRNLSLRNCKKCQKGNDEMWSSDAEH